MTSPRILIAVYELAGWGGAATSRYQLFARMQREGMDVAFVNLVDSADAIFFRHTLGPAAGNPLGLANVHTEVIDPPLWRPHPALAATIESLRPDLLVGVGFIATRLLRQACASAPLVMLTSGSRRLKQLVDDGTVRDLIAFQRNIERGIRYPPPSDDPEGLAVEAADLIIPHCPPARLTLEEFFRTQTHKLYARDLSIADLVYDEAREFEAQRRAFEERDIDVLLACSSWQRCEKNLPLLRRLAAAMPGRAIHVVGDLAEALPVVRHGVVDRATLFALMGRARVLACPSLFDAAPAVLFEASSMGCNVVASPNCGNHGLCHPDLLAEKASAAAFARCIERGVGAPYADNREQFLGGYRELTETLIAFAPDAPRRRRSPTVRPTARSRRALSSGAAPLPAFLIAGAKKCASSTLHRVLAARPDVFMPDREVGFFAADADLHLDQYTALFRAMPSGKLPGERSTMYFASAEAPRRIAATLPDVKLLFLLRDPVMRTYSHYWHRVWNFREGRSFEDTIADPRHPILSESEYRASLERYFDQFDRSQIKVVLFEDLIAYPQRVLNEIAAFLRLAPDSAEVALRRANRTVYPRWPRVVLDYNRLRRRIPVAANGRVLFRPTNRRLLRRGGLPIVVQCMDATVRRVAFSPDVSMPPMRADTRARLGDYFARANRGLSSLIGIDVSSFWPLFPAAAPPER